MSRPAEELLEFDRLKEIVSRATTCLPGRRAIEELAPGHDGQALQSEFVLIREAIEYLRAGSELGFGSLADPEPWLARLAVPGRRLAEYNSPATAPTAVPATLHTTSNRLHVRTS